jgi:hypothetical protein
MTPLKRFGAAAVVAIALTVASTVAAAPAAASPPSAGAVTATSSTLLPAPTYLRQIGIDSYGYPILAWTWGSPDERGSYIVRYQFPDQTAYTDDIAFSSYSGQPYDTFGAAAGFCLPGGMYQVTVYYGQYYPKSGPSNTITITLPDGPQA